MDFPCGYFFNRFGYPIFHNILVGANMIVVLSRPFCVYRLEHAYFQINKYTFWSNLEIWSALVLHNIFELYHAKTIYMIGWLSSWVVGNSSLRYLELVPFHDEVFQSNSLPRFPLSFKHVNNQKPRFGWIKIKFFFFISDIR